MTKILVRTMLLLFMLVGVSDPARAMVIVPADLGELARDAKAIVRGRVASVDARWTDDRRSIESIVTLEVESTLERIVRTRRALLRARRPGRTIPEPLRGRAGIHGGPASHCVSGRAWAERAVPARDEPGCVPGRGGRQWRVARDAAGAAAVDGGHRADRQGRSEPPSAAARRLRTARACAGGRCPVRRRGGVVASVIAAVLLSQAQPALAYLTFGVPVNGELVTLKWARPQVRYYISDTSTVPGVSVDQFQAAVARAFDRWQAVPTSAITYQFGGFTSALPGEDDGLSTLGVVNRPDLNRVLASTSFLIDTVTGELIESDIFFNAALPWSVAAAGEADTYDLESIALHEIGHMSGLAHSALGETELREGGGRRVIAAAAVMFPIAFAAGSVAQRTLQADDIAGISDLYPDGGFATALGSISGRVTMDGRPIFGAHVVAFDPATRSMVAAFTLTPRAVLRWAVCRPARTYCASSRWTTRIRRASSMRRRRWTSISE